MSNNKIIHFLGPKANKILYLSIIIIIAGHISNVFILQKTRPDIKISNISVSAILFIVALLHKYKKITTTKAFASAILVVLVNILLTLIFSCYYNNSIGYVFSKNILYVSFLLSAAILFCGKRFALIIPFMYFSTIIPLYTIYDLDFNNDLGVVATILFLCFAFLMNYFSDILISAISKIEQDKICIAEKNNELSILMEKQQEEAKIIKEQNKTITKKNSELSIQEQNLKIANSTKDRFFSIIAHDLKNPMGAILGFSEMFERNYSKLSNTKRIQYSHKINKAALSMCDLLGNLLTWAKSQLNSIEIQKEVLDFNNLLTMEIEPLNEIAKQKSITIEHKNNTDNKFFADAYMTRTVIRNLISNAIKFSNTGASIEVKSSKADNEFKCVITDHGIGIPEEYLGSIFDLDSTLKREGTLGESSSGLGLILCKDFIEKQGGEIGVESKENIGSSFWFTLPAGTTTSNKN